jgi:hypothetical protein
MEVGLSWNKTSDTYTRLGAAAGQSRSFFDTIYPWVDIKRCNLGDDGIVTAYLGDDDYSVNGSNGQVMVEIPKFYYKEVTSNVGTLYSWWISSTPAQGYKIHPAFVRDGQVYQYMYVGAYKASAYDVTASATEVNTITVTAGASASGNLTITLDGNRPITVAVTAGDTAEQVAAKLRAATYNCAPHSPQSFAASGADAACILTCSVPGLKTTTVFAAAATGVTATVVKSVAGAGGYMLNDPAGRVNTATTGDKLASVSGVKPISGWKTSLTLPEARTLAHNRGTGWEVIDFLTASALQLLYLVEYASFNSQATLGNGILSITDDAATNMAPYNGQTNALGNVSGSATGQTHYQTGQAANDVTYRGVEGFFGNLWEWTDGINIKADYKPWIADNGFASDTFAAPYVDSGLTLCATDGYVTDIALDADNDYGFLASAVGGSASAKLCDYYYRAAGNKAALRGGFWYVGSYGGAFFWYLIYAASFSSRYVGARLAFVDSPAENPYNEYIQDTTLTGDITNGRPLVISTANNYDTTPTLSLNGYDVNCSGVYLFNGASLNCGSGTINTVFLDSTAGTLTPETSKFVFQGVGNLKLKAGQTLYDAEFTGTTTIFQNTVLTGNLAIANGATITDGAGTYRINATNAGTPVHSLLGSWDFPIYLDGGAALCSVAVNEPMGGTVYFNGTTTFAFGTDTMTFVPDGWCDMVLLGWNEVTLNLYGAFYFNGNAVANMTIADDARYALWNGSASLGIFLTDGYLNATLNATSTLTMTVNPCPVFTNTAPLLDNYGDHYLTDIDTNEETAPGVTYTLNVSAPGFFIGANDGSVQGSITQSENITFSLMADDGFGGITYYNWTVSVSMLNWNLRVHIVTQENGWNKIQFDFDFEGNEDLLTKVQWNFGDGNGSKYFDPTHQYQTAGKYMVTVAIYDEFGSVGYTTAEITVGDPTNEDQYRAQVEWWFQTQFLGFMGIIIASIILAGIYVYLADKQYGGANRLFPVAMVASGLLCALLFFGGL